jgi:hypothetical protein
MPRDPEGSSHVAERVPVVNREPPGVRSVAIGPGRQGCHDDDRSVDRSGDRAETRTAGAWLKPVASGRSCPKSQPRNARPSLEGSEVREVLWLFGVGHFAEQS